MLYRYRLRGFDDEWKLTSDTQASYGQLPPGNYTFEVAAIDRDLSHSESPAVVRVQVEREYRQAVLWFGLVCAIITAVLLAVMVIRRTRGIRRLNVELDQRVRVRTAELQSEVAENRKLQQQLLQTQKLDAVGTMASGIAHDFNNSLAAIRGFAELAKSVPSKSSGLIDHILTACHQAAGTSRSLLTFSQRSTGERSPEDLIQMMRNSSDFLQKMLPSSIRLSSDFQDSSSIWCSIDTTQIQQMILNITMNARDALSDGGEISLTAKEHPAQSGVALLAISDNGTGMSQDVLQKLFDPFITTKSRGQGTGLGMAVVHGIVEAHGGTISGDSSVGQGTTVSIALPRCSADEAFSASAESSDPPDLFVEGRGETILVAEDNPEVRTMIEDQLRSAGFGVLSTCDGKQVLDVVQKQAAEIQAVLLDIDLPEKDGLTCLKEINDQYPQLPVIMMSGLSSADPKKLATAFLRKPFSRKRLLSAIRDVLSTASAHKANGVLIVDDNEAVRVSTRDMVDNEDFDVFVANNGSEAASELRQHRDLIGTVLLDWNIPHTDPLATLHELRRISPGVRILVVSGDLTLQASEIESKGFSRLLRKPFSGAELIEAVA